MTKITLTDVGSIAQNPTSTATTINNNSDIIVTAIENTLSRDGTAPNQMASSLDMNSNRVVNLPAPIGLTEPLRLQDLETFNGAGTIQGVPVGGTTGQILTKHSNTNYDVQWSSGAGSGTVTSVGLSLPVDFNVTGSPVNTTGTLTATFANSPTGTGGFVRSNSPNITTPTGIVKNDVGLANVDNTSDATKNAAAVTLTNKTITAPIIATIVNSGTLTLPTTTDVIVGRSTTDNLSNKTLISPSISTISNTGTLTLPTTTDTLVGRTTTDTLTNKTINGGSNTLTGITLSSMATQNANTIVGNFTGSSAAPTAVDISTLTSKGSPAGTDIVLISDQGASGQLKRTTVSAIGASSGVSGIDALTGAFTTSNGLTSSGNSLQLTTARRTLPTNQTFLTGSATYTTPANVLWIEVYLQGGGGGGGGSGVGATAGSAGSATTWGSTLLSAGGGNGGGANGNGGGTGGAIGGSTTAIKGIAGSSGNGGGSSNAGVNGSCGGTGGCSALGGAGGGGAQNVAGFAAATNSGSGGGGAGFTSTISQNSGGGGGAGANIYHIFNTPAATYAYSVGAGNTGGAAGTSGQAGGTGAAGQIIVIEHYGT